MRKLRQHGRRYGKRTQMPFPLGARGSPRGSARGLPTSAAFVFPLSPRWFQLTAVIKLARQHGRAKISH